jgi:hypothetical protein
MQNALNTLLMTRSGGCGWFMPIELFFFFFKHTTTAEDRPDCDENTSRLILAAELTVAFNMVFIF